MEDTEPPGEHEAITARNATTSPLLRLPAELRNKIYAYVLTEPDEALSFDDASLRAFNHRRLDNIPRKTADQPHHLALLYSCRQSHAEAKSLPFELNVFKFSDLSIFTTITIAIFKPFQRAAIARIRVSSSLRHFETLMAIAYLKNRGYDCARDLLPQLVSAQLIFGGRASNRHQEREYNKMQLVTWFKGAGNDVQVTEEGPYGVVQIA